MRLAMRKAARDLVVEEIRVLNRDGSIECIIPFGESGNKL